MRPIALIVEDDPDSREALEDVVDHIGFSAVGAKHGLAALRYLTGADPLPTVILLDLMMPVMNGWEFLEQRTPAVRSIPVFVLTATPNAAVPAGVPVILKPVTLEELTCALQALRQ
jgi:CheY-like chemotaxis protein